MFKQGAHAWWFCPLNDIHKDDKHSTYSIENTWWLAWRSPSGSFCYAGNVSLGDSHIALEIWDTNNLGPNSVYIPMSLDSALKGRANKGSELPQLLVG
jgi:hypothetical protein